MWQGGIAARSQLPLRQVRSVASTDGWLVSGLRVPHSSGATHPQPGPALIALLYCLFGFAALILGADLLVRGGSRLAAAMHIPPMIIGLTLVSVGTSFPELAVGIEAALVGSGSLAVANIAGTNTVNILLILGLSALLAPLPIEIRTLRLDLPSMIAAAFALQILALDGVLSRLDGLVLVGGGVAYTVLLIRSAWRRRRAVRELAAEVAATTPPPTPMFLLQNLALLVVGIVVIVVGADWLVEGSVDLARMLGVSESFIGLTVVAIGTSAPELVTTIVSTLRRDRDIAIGNLIGSSVYNIAFILGVTLLVPADGIAVEQDLITIDIPVMVAVAVVCLPVFLGGRRVSRLEGGVFVASYVIYIAALTLTRSG